MDIAVGRWPSEMIDDEKRDKKMEIPFNVALRDYGRWADSLIS